MHAGLCLERGIGMNANQLMTRAETLIEAAKTAVLATVDGEGRPHMRWMSPAFLPKVPGSLFAITTPTSAKALQARENQHVEWMIQDPSLREVIQLRGIMSSVDNPALKSAVQETLGPRLATFWKIHDSDTEYTVLETVLVDGSYFASMDGTVEHVEIRKEG